MSNYKKVRLTCCVCGKGADVAVDEGDGTLGDGWEATYGGDGEVDGNICYACIQAARRRYYEN